LRTCHLCRSAFIIPHSAFIIPHSAFIIPHLSRLHLDVRLSSLVLCLLKRESHMSENRLLARLQQGAPLLSDGAMGTMLQEAGLTDGGAPELWNVKQPEVVRAIYQGYIDAGSHIISTNTFGGTSARLKLHNLQDRVHELNVAGVRLAREVADPAGVLVAASVGPSGELIEPLGPLTLEEATEIFAEQAAALADGGADFILIETMSDLREVEAAVKGAQKATDLPIVVTMTFDTNFHTMMGVSPAQAVQTLSQWGVFLIGANCGNGPAEIEAIMTEMAQNRPQGIYLMAQSNAGMPQYNKGVISYDGTPDVMANYAITMRNLGINVIGGCCGTTPTHLKAMAAALERVKDEPIPGAGTTIGADIEDDESRAARRDARRAARRQRVSE
jgi:5-methyltetrahydrofolate--homocysteine methyltransferase